MHSAATYGGGEFGYDDNHSEIAELKPNIWAIQDFDLWLLSRFKFFVKNSQYLWTK